MNRGLNMLFSRDPSSLTDDVRLLHRGPGWKTSQWSLSIEIIKRT